MGMNFTLDMKTVFTLVALGHLCTMILISVYRRQFARDPAIRLYSLSKWLQGTVWGISVFRFLLPPLPGIVLPNVILFVATGLETGALLMVIGSMTSRVKRYMTVLTGISIAGYLLIYVSFNEEWLRICFSSLMIAMLIAYPAYCLMRDKQASALKKTLSAMYGLLCLGLLLRSVLSIGMTEEMSVFAQANIYQHISYFALFFMMLVGSIGFVLLSKEQADGKLLLLASYDDLTGVLNRRTFIERSERCIEELVKSQEPVSFILFDIDHYKKINDTYGHETGDKVLQDMTDRINQLIEGRGMLGRYGGDEFAVLLPGLGTRESDELVEQLRSHTALYGGAETRIPYTLSLGIVTVPARKGLTAAELYQLSDQALYTAKRTGRNRVERSRRPIGSESAAQ